MVDEICTEASGMRIVDGPGELSAIGARSSAAVMWRRSPPRGVQSWIDAQDPARLPHVREILRPGAVPGRVGEILGGAGLAPSPEREWLARDIALLAERFASIVTTPYLRLRLDRVTTNACRKFHKDAVTARLICTYRGTGTQYGWAEGAGEPQRIFTVPTGAPVILRGTRWPEEPQSALLHRSPPIEGTGETRLVLVLDPVAGLEDD